MKRYSLLFLLCIFSMQMIFASNNGATQAKRDQYDGKKPKYIFYFIGDGFGLSQANATEAYMAAVNGAKGIQHLAMSTFPCQGFYTTYADNRFITGSAASDSPVKIFAAPNVATVGTTNFSPAFTPGTLDLTKFFKPSSSPFKDSSTAF